MNGLTLVAATVLVMLAVGCAEEDSIRVLPHAATVLVEARSGSFSIPVEVVATPEARRRGLKGRTVLRPDHGMLFLYAREEARGFWMKDCLVPIDAAYVAGDGRIANIAEMAPEPGVEWPRSYPSTAPVSVVLEMPGGWFRDHAVEAGDRVIVPDALLDRVRE